MCFLSVGEASIAVSISPLRKKETDRGRDSGRSHQQSPEATWSSNGPALHQTAKPHCFPSAASGAGLGKESALLRRAEWWFTIHSPGHSVKRSTDAPALNCRVKACYQELDPQICFSNGSWIIWPLTSLLPERFHIVDAMMGTYWKLLSERWLWLFRLNEISCALEISLPTLPSNFSIMCYRK